MGRIVVKSQAGVTRPRMATTIKLPLMAGNSESRLVYLTGDVTEESIAEVQRTILDLSTHSKQPIHLVVSTYGGAVHEMFSLYDVMKFVPCPIHTVALGKVMSAGSLIFAAGEKGNRLIGASTRVMIHALSAGFYGNYFELLNSVDEVKELQRMYVERLARETKMSPKKIEDLLNSKLDMTITPKQAVELGIADRIIE
jgi:ATP-dependent Clp protease protease subunit